MTTLSQEHAIRYHQSAMVLAEALRDHPSKGYLPNPIQEAMHRSSHTVRLLCPGNGLGKTWALWMEISMWLDHNERFRTLPWGPLEIILFVQEFGQFRKVQQLMETCIPGGFTWHEQDHYYDWRDGSRVYVESCEKSWKVSQGTNPHLVAFDEKPPFAIWNELRMRKRGTRDTEFLFAATMTDGGEWCEQLFYDPWIEAHKQAGVSIDDALLRQIHPDVWLWHRGGIDDNPHVSAKQKAWFHAQKFASEEEKRIRLYGGFGRFNQRPVFDQQSLRDMLEQIDEWDKARGPGRNRGICRVEAA